MILGTAYFPSLDEAYKYYSTQGISASTVRLKVQQKEIFIGKPKLKKGEFLSLIDEKPGKRFRITNV